MPGLSASHALIFNEDLRKRFRIYMDAGELDIDVYKRQIHNGIRIGHKTLSVRSLPRQYR